MPTTNQTLKAQEALGLSTPAAEFDFTAQVVDSSPTDVQITERQVETDNGPGFTDAVGASFRVDNSAKAIYDNLTDPDFFYDAGFNAVDYIEQDTIKARLDALTLADRDDVSDIMGGAFNQDHADFLLERLEAKQADEVTISEAGAAGFVARIGANILDPVDIAVTALAAPVGAVVKAKKLGRIAAIAGTAAAGNAAVEAVVAQDNPFRDETDILIAGLAGLTLGGALGSLSRADNLRIEKLANDVADNGLDSAGAARRVLNESDGTPDGPARPKAEEAFDEAFEEAPEFHLTFADRAMHNLRGSLFNGSTGARTFASRILEGGFLGDKSKTRVFTAEGRADSIRRSMLARYTYGSQDAFKAWSKENGFGSARRIFGTKAGEEFRLLVTDALRGADNVSPHAQRAAKVYREVLDEIGAMAQEAGIKGFDKELLVNYVPRVYNKGQVLVAQKKFGNDNFAAYFREAILNFDGDIPEELADKIARGMTKTITESASGVEQTLTHGINLDDADDLRRLLGDTADVDQIIEAIQEVRATRSTDTGLVTSRAKPRVRLDENYSAPVKTLDGNVEVLKLSDLLENDAHKLVSRYLHSMSGHIGLAKEAGIKSQADWEAALTAIRSKAAGEGKNALSEVEALDKARKLLTGTSIEANPNSKFSQLARVAGDADFIRLSGKFGVAQIAEIGNIVAVGTWRTLSRLPGTLFTRKLTKRDSEGLLQDPIARQLERWFGPGSDFETNPATRGFDEFGEGFDLTTVTGRTLQKIDGPVQVASRVASQVSLMAPINARIERIAGFEHVMALSDYARGTRKLTDAQRARWRGAGVSDEMMGRILGQIKKHATYEGRTLKSLNAEKWKSDVADAAQQGIRTQTSFTVQRNDIGDLPLAIHGPFFKTVLRFKSFMLGSINKQLNRGIHYADAETAVAWTSGMFFAGLAYTAQVEIDFANDPEKRAELLTPEKVAEVAFQRAGFAAILVPAASTVANVLGYDELFNQRTSGLSSFLSMDSNPTSQFLADVGNTALLPLNLLHGDYRFSQKDLRRIERILPFNRVLAVKNFLHMLEEELPKSSKK